MRSRALQRGVWVLDCGHPPYGGEMHPPTFLALASPDGDATAAVAAVARTGVDVTVTPYDDSGCVRVQAQMTAAYTPMPLPYVQAEWSWDALSASQSDQLGQPIDVRAQIVRAIRSLGLDADVPAPQPGNPPLIDAYAPLDPGPDAARTDGKEVVTDDAQAFPFYGHVHAGWR